MACRDNLIVGMLLQKELDVLRGERLLLDGQGGVKNTGVSERSWIAKRVERHGNALHVGADVGDVNGSAYGDDKTALVVVDGDEEDRLPRLVLRRREQHDPIYNAGPACKAFL